MHYVFSIEKLYFRYIQMFYKASPNILKRDFERKKEKWDIHIHNMYKYIKYFFTFWKAAE